MEDEKRLMKRQRQGRQECARHQQAARQAAQNERVDIQRLQLYTKRGVEGGPWMQQGVFADLLGVRGTLRQIWLGSEPLLITDEIGCGALHGLTLLALRLPL